MKQNIYTALRENGQLIDLAESIEQAKQLIDSYEQEDRENGIFEPNQYDIETQDHHTVYAYTEGIGSEYDRDFLRENGYI